MTAAPYTREWHTTNIDRLTGELAEVLVRWHTRDREISAKGLAARITTIARSLSAETHAIGQLDYQEWVRRGAS